MSSSTARIRDSALGCTPARAGIAAGAVFAGQLRGSVIAGERLRTSSTSSRCSWCWRWSAPSGSRAGSRR